MSTIEDERVELLRHRVMTGVDTEVRGRARRIRRGFVGVGVAAVVLVVGGAVLPQLAPTSGDDSAASSSGSGDEGGSLVEAPEIAEDSAGGSTADRDLAPPTEDREVIVTGSVHVVTDDPRAASSDLAAWVEARRGRIDARDLTDPEGEGAYASVTVRVPSDQVNATIEHLESYGAVDAVSLGNDDVTSTVRDLDARISALRVSIERLEKVVTDAADSDELVRAEQALTDRQSQLEQLLTEQKSLGEQVALATVQVDFSADERAQDVDPDGFLGGLVSGWNALVGAVNGLVTVVGVLLPWLGVLLVLGLGYRGVRRARAGR